MEGTSGAGRGRGARGAAGSRPCGVLSAECPPTTVSLSREQREGPAGRPGVCTPGRGQPQPEPSGRTQSLTRPYGPWRQCDCRVHASMAGEGRVDRDPSPCTPTPPRGFSAPPALPHPPFTRVGERLPLPPTLTQPEPCEVPTIGASGGHSSGGRVGGGGALGDHCPPPRVLSRLRCPSARRSEPRARRKTGKKETKRVWGSQPGTRRRRSPAPSAQRLRLTPEPGAVLSRCPEGRCRERLREGGTPPVTPRGAGPGAGGIGLFQPWGLVRPTAAPASEGPHARLPGSAPDRERLLHFGF